MRVLASCALVLASALAFAPQRSSGWRKLFGVRFATVHDVVSAPVSLDTAAADIPQSPVIVGAGPTGLASALLLARLGWSNITLYDRLPAPPAPASEEWGNAERSYNIGINGRGQNSLAALGVLPRMLEYSSTVVGRMDWSPEAPEGVQTFRNRTASRIVQRDRIASVLIEEVVEKYGDRITINHGVSCEKLSRTGEDWALTFKTEDGAEITTTSDFVIGADGVKSRVRSTLEEESGMVVKRYPPSNVRVYRTIRLSFPDSWRKDLNYSHRGKSGLTIDALPTKEGIFVGVVLFRPHDTRVDDLKTVDEAKALFKSEFPQLSEYIRDEDYEAFVKKRTVQLPGFSVAGPVLHNGGNMVLLGDAIHTVKPYFGMGVNSAFEDVTFLGQELQKGGFSKTELPKSLASFSKTRAREAKALVRMSRRLDGGFFTFILPIILDSTLNKFFPWLCAPNTIAMLQKENLTFSQISRRKRIDRLVQVGLGVGLLYATTKVLAALLGWLWKGKALFMA